MSRAFRLRSDPAASTSSRFARPFCFGSAVRGREGGFFVVRRGEQQKNPPPDAEKAVLGRRGQTLGHLSARVLAPSGRPCGADKRHLQQHGGNTMKNDKK